MSWTPEHARAAVEGERLARKIARLEAELEGLRERRDQAILILDTRPGMTSREIGEIVNLSHVIVRRIINRHHKKDMAETVLSGPGDEGAKRWLKVVS